MAFISLHQAKKAKSKQNGNLDQGIGNRKRMGLADAIIVVGSGLAGLTATLTLLDQEPQSRVIILEKEAKLGGNSIKASSGINYCETISSSSNNDSNNESNDDSKDLFVQDTVQSAGRVARTHLIETLVEHSQNAVQWLEKRIGADLSLQTQLGGHSTARTHRPSGKMPVGAELMSKIQKTLGQEFGDNSDRLTILTQAQVCEILMDDTENKRVTGVKYTLDGQEKELQARAVVLATGGFAADRSSSSLLMKHRPELVQFATTGGDFSAGDGIRLATNLSKTNAATVDMDHIQVHPTGFVDPKDPEASTKFLAAEILRGVGGILLNSKGKRFCDELGRRDYVTDEALSSDGNEHFITTKQWRAGDTIPQMHLLLSEQAAAQIDTHMGFYVWKGLMTKVTGGIEALAKHMQTDETILRETITSYHQQAESSSACDAFGKNRFPNPPNPQDDVFYVGLVTPVLHYCMGGLKIDTSGRVLTNTDEQTPISGLYACGEVAGGVHGENRLGGNSLLECVVYGRIVGMQIAAEHANSNI